MKNRRLRRFLTCCACVLAIAVVCSQSSLERRISLDFNSTAPDAVFRMVAEALKCTLEIDPAVQQLVTIRLDRVTVKLALDAVCESIGCRWKFDGGQLTVAPAAMSPRATGGVVGNSDLVRAAIARPLPPGLRFVHQPVGAVLEAVARAAGPNFNFRIDGPEARIAVTVDVSGRTPTDAVQAIVRAAGLVARCPISSIVDADGVIRTFTMTIELVKRSPSPSPLEQLLAKAAESAAAFADPNRKIVCEEEDRQTFLEKGLAALDLPWAGLSTPGDEPMATRTVVATLTIEPAPLESKSRAPWEETLRIVTAGSLQPAGPIKAPAIRRIFGKVPNYPATWSTPLPRLTAVLLHAALQPRFRFTKAGEQRVSGVLAQEIQFREITTPALLGAPLSGSFWVDPASGHVLKSTIRITKAGANDEMTVTYSMDQPTGLWLPASLRQRTDSRAAAAVVEVSERMFIETKGAFTKCHAGTR